MVSERFLLLDEFIYSCGCNCETTPFCRLQIWELNTRYIFLICHNSNAIRIPVYLQWILKSFWLSMEIQKYESTFREINETFGSVLILHPCSFRERIGL